MSGFTPPTPLYTAGEPQEETLARIDYLRDQGGGWCEVVGPKRIGKSALLSELSRRARRLGESCIQLDIGTVPANEWLWLAAGAWNLDATLSPVELRRALEEHVIGQAAMNRAVWILADQVDDSRRDIAAGFRWLTGLARRHGLALTIVSAGRSDGDTTEIESDLRLELWPWDVKDCRRYLADFCRVRRIDHAFSADAVAYLAEHSGGVPGELARLAEWSWLAAQAESEPAIGPDLVDAVAEEMSAPRFLRQRSYEVSAAYGAW